MEFQAGDKVLYVPLHCGSDLEHKDVQKGTISESKVQPQLEFNYERKVGKKNIDFCLDISDSCFVRGRVTQFDDAEVRRRLSIPPEADVEYSITMSYEKKPRSYKSQLVF